MRKLQDYQAGITSKKQEKLDKQVYRQSGQEAKDLKKASEAKRTGEAQESFIWGTLLNTTTYMVIFFLLIFGSSITLYQSQPERYSWLDSNGEFKTETYDVTVSYNLDTPLDDLNQNSLNQVFKDNNLVLNGDFTNGLTYWDVQFQLQTYILVVNDRLTFNSEGNPFVGDSLRGQDISLPTGNEYYVTWNASQAHISLTQFDVVFANYASYSGISNASRYSSVQGTNSLIRNAGTNGIRMFFQVRNNSIINISFDDIYVIDLDALGINQTKDEMDYWYSEYQRLQENRIEDMKYLGGEVVSSWYTTTQILMQIGDVIQTIYDNSPVAWIIDLFADIGV